MNPREKWDAIINEIERQIRRSPEANNKRIIKDAFKAGNCGYFNDEAKKGLFQFIIGELCTDYVRDRRMAAVFEHLRNKEKWDIDNKVLLMAGVNSREQVARNLFKAYGMKKAELYNKRQDYVSPLINRPPLTWDKLNLEQQSILSIKLEEDTGSKRFGESVKMISEMTGDKIAQMEKTILAYRMNALAKMLKLNDEESCFASDLAENNSLSYESVLYYVYNYVWYYIESKNNKLCLDFNQRDYGLKEELGNHEVMYLYFMCDLSLDDIRLLLTHRLPKESYDMDIQRWIISDSVLDHDFDDVIHDFDKDDLDEDLDSEEIPYSFFSSVYRIISTSPMDTMEYVDHTKMKKEHVLEWLQYLKSNREYEEYERELARLYDDGVDYETAVRKVASRKTDFPKADFPELAEKEWMNWEELEKEVLNDSRQLNDNSEKSLSFDYNGNSLGIVPGSKRDAQIEILQKRYDTLLKGSDSEIKARIEKLAQEYQAYNRRWQDTIANREKNLKAKNAEIERHNSVDGTKKRLQGMVGKSLYLEELLRECRIVRANDKGIIFRVGDGYIRWTYEYCHEHGYGREYKRPLSKESIYRTPVYLSEYHMLKSVFYKLKEEHTKILEKYPNITSNEYEMLAEILPTRISTISTELPRLKNEIDKRQLAANGIIKEEMLPRDINPSEAEGGDDFYEELPDEEYAGFSEVDYDLSW